MGHESTGGVLSCTLIVALQEAVLPQSSVAIQVRVTLYSPGHTPSTEISEKVISGISSHASMAVAIPKEGVDPQSIGDSIV